MMICSPFTLRSRVLFTPMYSTVPAKSSTCSESPRTNGRSSVIDSDANRSPRMFCAASATAMPPMPRPASSGLIWMPRLPSVSSSTNDQIVNRAMKPMMPSEPAAARSTVSVLRCLRSSAASTRSRRPQADLPEARDGEHREQRARQLGRQLQRLQSEEHRGDQQEPDGRAARDVQRQFQELFLRRRREARVLLARQPAQQQQHEENAERDRAGHDPAPRRIAQVSLSNSY